MLREGALKLVAQNIIIDIDSPSTHRGYCIGPSLQDKCRIRQLSITFENVGILSRNEPVEYVRLLRCRRTQAASAVARFESHWHEAV